MSQELNVYCPQTNELLETVAYTGREQMLELVDRACAAQKKWEAVPLYERGEILYRFADLLEQDAEHISVLMAKDMGKPILQARDETGSGSRLLRAAVERAKHLYGEVLTENSPGMEGDIVFTKREPLGVIACVIPFNFPIELTFQKIAPALIMGNAAIVKAPSSTPLAVLALAEIAQKAGLPEDVVSFVACERDVMNECVVANPKVVAVSMTGSTGAGRELAAKGGGDAQAHVPRARRQRCLPDLRRCRRGPCRHRDGDRPHGKQRSGLLLAEAVSRAARHLRHDRGEAGRAPRGTAGRQCAG